MRKIFSSIIMLFITLNIFAVPARKQPVVFTQPDGSTIALRQYGDEFYHYLTDLEGNVMTLNEEGYYVKADSKTKNSNEIRCQKASQKHEARVRRKPDFVNIAPRGIVILVQFPTTGSGSNGTKASFTYTKTNFDNMLNQTGYSTNFTYTDSYYHQQYTINAKSCAREYFEAQSYGEYSPEFDVYASMLPAKEVGGDFYDFFLVDDDHLCMVMADVSGKGVPAALFMMASKIIL